MIKQKNKKYVVQLKIEQLRRLNKHTSEKSFGSDSSIIIEAMVDYINFSVTQPGMPMLLCEENKLYLIEGINLVEALNRSEYEKIIYCILKTNDNCNFFKEVQPFDINFANSLGKDFRVITFKDKITNDSLMLMKSNWGIKPEVLSDYSVGWPLDRSKSLGEFMAWRISVEKFSSSKIKVTAINGRRLQVY